MTTLTYCKGLPTPPAELNALGYSELEMFLEALAPTFRLAAVETVEHLLQLGESSFDMSKWNTALQGKYGINKRYANGVISFAKGKVEGAKEHRSLHLKTLEGKAKSISSWIKKAERKLKLARKFYAKKQWQHSKTGCTFPLSCSLKYKNTNWQNLKFQIHGKKRKLHLIQSKLEFLKTKPIRVSVPRDQVFIVGSKDETCGNQVAQWDGDTLKLRVPQFLESKFGASVSSEIGGFERTINRLPVPGAKTWHLFKKEGKWTAAVQFTPSEVKRQSQPRDAGCIGIDLNPGSIGWAYVDTEGNLKAKGRIPLEMGLPTGKQQAQIVDACLSLANLAICFACPVVCEDLDFANKKERLGEQGRKYARMLSSWAYSEFYKQVNSILSNRGIERIMVNPAYSSIIGLVKYMRMYGLSSDEAAGLVIARRGMRLSERLPSTLTAYVEVNSAKHVWSRWNQVNKKIKQSSKINRRHDYFTVSNWSFLANLESGAES